MRVCKCDERFKMLTIEYEHKRNGKTILHLKSFRIEEIYEGKNPLLKVTVLYK